ncbi:MAG: hypothetical protein ACT4OJ_08615 [Bacteroidota bacterium]
MKAGAKTYNTVHRISSIAMITALLWLTFSAPFVFSAQQRLAEEHRQEQGSFPVTGNEEETANPFGSTEEKAPSGTSFSEEYLHDHHAGNHFFSSVIRSHKCENADTYTAYHGELHVPPPNAS